MKKNKFLSFNDGIVSIYKVSNIAPKGDKPCEKLVFYNKYCFADKTVGLNRYYEAMQNNVQISRSILIGANDFNISPQMVAVIGNTQYMIIQVQTVRDTRPPHLILSLSEVEMNYEINTVS